MSSLVILISGRGSNMQALLDAGLPAQVAAVIGSRPDAAGLETARRHGLETKVVDPRSYPDRTAYDAALAETIDASAPDLVVLAGFMRILGNAFVDRYNGKLMNVHPSLLPAFPGLDTHARALREGVRIHGCTVHFVTPQLDHGPIVAQAAVPVWPEDTVDTLAARVLRQEHRIYPEAVRWFLQGRLSIADGRVRLDGAARQDAVLCSPEATT